MTSPRTAVERLRWRAIRPDGGCLHIARMSYRPGSGFGAHCHDFAEVMWCESGAGIHTVNGQELSLAPGDIVFLRPDDQHAAAARGAPGFTQINVAFAPHAIAALAERHPGRWPWRRGAMPLHARLTPRQLERLAEWADDLARADAELLDLDGFLLDLARLIAHPASRDPARGLPPWLRDALATFADPRHLAGGTARLAHLCGRGQAHLNRVVREAQGRTATDLVNDLRLAWAAGELRMSDHAIADIAPGCGLEHLGHFYRLFHARFGMTPRRYRMQARRVADERSLLSP